MTETPDTEEALPLPEELEGFLRRLESHNSKTLHEIEAARSFIPGAERLAERLPEAIRNEMGLRARLVQAIEGGADMNAKLDALADVIGAELSAIASAAHHRSTTGDKTVRLLAEIREDARSSFARLGEEIDDETERSDEGP